MTALSKTREIHTLALHHCGESSVRIALLLGRNPQTIRACLKNYQDGGLTECVCAQSNDCGSVRWQRGVTPPRSSLVQIVDSGYPVAPRCLRSRLS